MTNLLRKFGMPQIMYSPDEPAAAAASDAGADKAVSKAGEAASVLYPDDPAKAKPADGGAAEAEKPAAPAGDAWKEYEPDTTKTAEENAAAKAEHDKTKPADDAADDPSNKVPEDGKYELKMPEGVEVDAELVGALGPEFKELGLTTGQAQKLADKFIEIQTARAGKQTETWGNTVTGWVDTAKADKEIGGDKWNSTVASATRAVNTLGTPELKEYFEASGGGNHPELIRFMAKVGAMIKEDNPATGNAPGGQKADRLSVLYPNDKPKGK